MLEYADVAGAEVLRAYCLAVAVCNLDAVLLEAGGAFELLAPHLLAELERLYKLRLAGAGAGSGGDGNGVAGGRLATVPEAGGAVAGDEQAARPGSRLQPGRRPTAAAPWLGDTGLEVEALPAGVALPLPPGASSFRDRSEADAEAATDRLLRTLHKKLQQIDHLAAKAAAGAPLDAQQRCKLEQKPVIQSAVAALGAGMALDDVQAILRAAAGREAGEEEMCAPASSGKPAKSKAKLSLHKALPGEPALAAAAAGAGSSSTAAAEAGLELGAAEAVEALLGTSPPAASLVPVWGAGSAAAAAEQPRTPAVPAEQATTPRGQVRSLVGFASSAATDGVDAAAQRHQGSQPASVGRTLSGRPKSAAKRKGEST